MNQSTESHPTLFEQGENPIRALLAKTLGPIKAAELVAELRSCEGCATADNGSGASNA